ncbi:MAG: GNAT family N-acetyltransferase [Acidobacteria bacterium]|nr:GNAT family N-acetyltransferase [Acidobacteriota bacterium]
MNARRARISLRTGDPSDARRLHALITAAQADGHLLPRTLPDITQHAARFVVAVRNRRVVGCAELAPLSAQVAEVRSLVVDRSARSVGVGSMIVEELRARARREGFEKLSAFTHAPGYFAPMGFSIVPHLWVTEKIHTDCVRCPQFRQCGQYAMVLPLESLHDEHETDHLLVARHA